MFGGGATSLVKMDSSESRLIEILRVFCITAMMWVHVSPGMLAPSVVTTGDYALVGKLFGNTLGRASVSLLSFVSGYLLWHTARDAPLVTLARSRFRSVLLPMLVWSALFLLMALAKEPLTGASAHNLDGIDVDAESLANAWAGITGPTANRSLFFLRDLFVATLILRAAMPLIRHVPAIAIGAVLLAGANGILQPVIFRPSILQFLFFGAVAARLGYSISQMSRPFIALPVGYLIAVTGIAIAGMPENPLLGDLRMPEMLRRIGICVLFLAFTAALSSLFPRVRLHLLGRHAFLAYLMHVPLLGVLWALWQMFVGGPDDPTYLVFFLGAPILVFAAATVAGGILDRAPKVLQTALRGRIVRAGTRPGSD